MTFEEALAIFNQPFFTLLRKAHEAHIQHFDDASRSNVAFSDACEERIATQIIQTVHVELTGYQLM